MNIALLTASGIGSRTGQDIPKQFLHVDNIPIIIYTLKAFQNNENIDEICVVLLDGWEKMLTAYANQFNITKLKYIVSGGETGQDSIYNGLKAIREQCSDDDVVLIHDGNRPLISNEIIQDSLDVYKKYGDAVAAIPCTEVVFEVEEKDNQFGIKSVDRDFLKRTQTPHTYKLGDIIDIQERAHEKGIFNTAASCDLMRIFGRESHFSIGSEKNLKITTTEDLEIFRALLHASNDDWIK